MQVDIVGSLIDMAVDTQSSVNAMSVAVYSSLSNKPKLQSCSVKAFSFDGKTPIKAVGSFKATAKANKRSAACEFIVFEGVRDCLLSYKACTELGLVQLTYKLEAAEDRFTAAIKSSYPTLFTGRIGKMKGVELKLHIDTSVKPVYEATRRIPYHLQAQVETELRRMIADDVIEDATGPTGWVSEMVVVPKPNNDIRITIDSKKANKAIMRVRHNTPTVEDLGVLLNGAKFMSKLDMKGGFHQIVLDEASRSITTFRTPLSLKRYKRLSMGVCCASVMFQHEVEKALSGLIGVKNLVDDIFVWGLSQEDHDINLFKLLDRLAELELTVHPSKCMFGQTSLEFFGLKFSQEGVSLSDAKVRAIKEATRPTTTSTLRSFLGLASYCGRQIPQLATKAAPLWDLLKESQAKRKSESNSKLRWTEQQEQSFQLVKDGLINNAMGYFKRGWRTLLEVDASPVGVGAVLYQESPNCQKRQIVACWCQLLSEIETRYSQVEKEALAVVLACERFRHYLVGSQFTLITDCKAVELIISNPNAKPPARFARFLLRLMDYDFVVIHKPGTENLADYLSRSPIEWLNQGAAFSTTKAAEQYINFVSTFAAPRAINIEELIAATRADETLQEVARLVQSGQEPRSKHLAAYLTNRHELSVAPNGLLLRDIRIVIPSALREHMVRVAHEGHQGFVKIASLVRERIWFPGMRALVDNIIKDCPECQLSRGGGPQPLQMTRMPASP